VLWLRCLARPPGGAVRAAPVHLPQMLAAARAAAPADSRPTAIARTMSWTWQAAERRGSSMTG